jgi:LysM repeat protein
VSLTGQILLLAVTVAIPFSVQAGLLERVFGVDKTDSEEIKIQASNQGPIDTVLLNATNNPNPIGGRGGAEIIINEGTLVSTGPVGKDEMSKEVLNLGEIRVHTVREGETLSEIAEMFGVTTNTILWANDINRATGIRPGDSLVILPIVGVRHVVKTGDTISTIAKKYDGDADEILQYNQLASAEVLLVRPECPVRLRRG